MRAHTAYLWMETARRRDIVHLTPLVRAEVKKSGIQEGLCLVSSMHLTAWVVIRDNEREPARRHLGMAGESWRPLGPTTGTTAPAGTMAMPA